MYSSCWEAIERFEANVLVRHCDITPFGKLLLYLYCKEKKAVSVHVFHVYLRIAGVFPQLRDEHAAHFRFAAAFEGVLALVFFDNGINRTV